MNISLTKELEQFVQSKVKQGFYQSASEVVREGLRLIAEQDALRARRLELLNIEIDKGIESLKIGKVIKGDEAYKNLVKRRKAYSH